LVCGHQCGCRGAEDGSPLLEALAIATVADRLGYPEVWLGEGPTWDAFALATAVGLRAKRIALTAGPVPVHVRDPFSIARGASSAAVLIGRPVGVALGTSSTRVVEGVHGRRHAHPAAALADSAAAVKDLLGARISRRAGGNSPSRRSASVRPPWPCSTQTVCWPT